MKFTLSWLKDHLKTDTTVDRLVDAMTMAGLEVEEVHDPAAKLAPFTAARIVSAAKHPNADKLQVCQVETKDGMKEIVCGAPNARAGLVTAYAAIGTTIPGSGITLEARPVRGVVSNGMLCSGAELEVDSDADGILELDPKLAVGASVAEALGLSDPVIDFEVTPNRSDWLGVVGVARDLAAAGLGRFIAKPAPTLKGVFASPVTIAIDDETACPIFAARMIRGLKNGPSPAWLQQRLRAIGLRPRNILVDITNFFSYDRARPLHVYDADKLEGTVRARLGRAGESFKALDGKTYDVTPAMCVIADDARVLGIGGIMGGEYSGASDATTNALIESAYFDALRTFRTGRATGINSDARYRNERGIDPDSCVPELDRATQMILDLCGGEVSEPMRVGRGPAPPAPVRFDPDRVRALAGMSVKPARIVQILKALGFETAPEGGAKRLIVTPPSWRRDVEGAADLVEEIARIEGYDKVPAADPPRAEGYRAAAASVGESRLRVARRALASLGYLEAVTWSFCERRHADLFGGGAEALVLANPISADLDCMRPSALPNLIRAAQKNADRGHGDARLFEAGPAYFGDGDADQARTIAVVWRPAPKRHWRTAPAPDLFDVKRDCLALLETLAVPVASLQHADPDQPWQHPARAGGLRLGPKIIARFGEVHPTTLKALDAEGPVLVFEILVDALPAPRAKPTRAKPPLEMSDFMPLTRDFAFVVDEKVAAGDVVRAAIGAERPLITDVALFDVYRGPGVPEGKKSLAIEVTLEPRERTLADADIDLVSKKIVAAVIKATGAVQRA
ncbi:MAG: phenylalanine--tRNA ligase subunit beta [Alphaproteobacteria bacterium]|nr:phenylalanine--tRNA ligase subunit beta [Alphaproteobacteria bacterium]